MIPSHVFIGVMIPCRALTSKAAKLFAKKGLLREISADDQKNLSTHFSQFFTHRLVDLQNDQNLEEMFKPPFFFFFYICQFLFYLIRWYWGVGTAAMLKGWRNNIPSIFVCMFIIYEQKFISTKTKPSQTKPQNIKLLSGENWKEIIYRISKLFYCFHRFSHVNSHFSWQGSTFPYSGLIPTANYISQCRPSFQGCSLSNS